jgi:acetamidase/formamidase
MGAGATLMLPVVGPDALFFRGDGRARQGDGDVVGQRYIETSLDVEFSVELIKRKNMAPPENHDFMRSRALNEVLQYATGRRRSSGSRCSTGNIREGLSVSAPRTGPSRCSFQKARLSAGTPIRLP